MSRKACTCTLLNELNTYLAPRADLPSYRRAVDTSGQNLAWLRKCARAGRLELPERIGELVHMDIKELVA